ncbi:hypothetical protein HBH70_020510 [Parastagonospora nodorum]|nr:hypothetical protein HBH50_109530 [Parastagonospora nodorum]KAH4088223.1 hypothetical protein HBH48_126500 [Parastagonospora nodorum]KAH4821441.1 hypothetical protein HBH61_019370 [Parastagonospora nodorum]KAH5083805.1 hypothetical protein HBH95_034190 [Parastagonospora nodorum]KAH5149959.1 hypothetical protein HBH70_020510 [Parastagonospora nodorum]
MRKGFATWSWRQRQAQKHVDCLMLAPCFHVMKNKLDALRSYMTNTKSRPLPQCEAKAHKGPQDAMSRSQILFS